MGKVVFSSLVAGIVNTVLVTIAILLFVWSVKLGLDVNAARDQVATGGYLMIASLCIMAFAGLTILVLPIAVGVRNAMKATTNKFMAAFSTIALANVLPFVVSTVLLVVTRLMNLGDTSVGLPLLLLSNVLGWAVLSVFQLIIPGLFAMMGNKK